MDISVLTTTYNSEKSIEKTVLSILSQRMHNFSVEYIIYDDASTDNTVSVIESIKKRHSKGDIIKLYKQSNNQGVMINFFSAVLKSKGKYIAFCDSDDIWEDKNKLERQFNFLDANLNVSIVYHRFINKVNNINNFTSSHNFEEKLNIPLKKPQTSTMMVRGVLRSLINKNVVSEAQGPQNDQYLRFLLSQKGKFVCLENISPNIRLVRENSIFSTVDKLERKKKALQSWQTFYKYHREENIKKFLENKVKGFQSSVYWLEYEKYKTFNMYKRALWYDIGNGVIIRRKKAKLKSLITSPVIAIRNKIMI